MVGENKDFGVEIALEAMFDTGFEKVADTKILSEFLPSSGIYSIRINYINAADVFFQLFTGESSHRMKKCYNLSPCFKRWREISRSREALVLFLDEGEGLLSHPSYLGHRTNVCILPPPKVQILRGASRCQQSVAELKSAPSDKT